jgi:hypothetical protein
MVIDNIIGVLLAIIAICAAVGGIVNIIISCKEDKSIFWFGISCMVFMFCLASGGVGVALLMSILT